jgi:hypothetical protein
MKTKTNVKAGTAIPWSFKGTDGNDGLTDARRL